MQHQENLPGMEADPDLTYWISGQPPCSGWWDTKTRYQPGIALVCRRYWHADVGRWSYGVLPGFSDYDAQLFKLTYSKLDTHYIVYRGLKQPHVDGCTVEQWEILIPLYGDPA